MNHDILSRRQAKTPEQSNHDLFGWWKADIRNFFSDTGHRLWNHQQKSGEKAFTPLKINMIKMKPENQLLEKEIPFGNHHF